MAPAGKKTQNATIMTAAWARSIPPFSPPVCTLPAPLLPLPLPLPLSPAELPPPGVEMPPFVSETKGLLSDAMVAWVESTWNWTVESCWEMPALSLVVASEEPLFQAPIQSSGPFSEREPELHLTQFGQTKLATMLPSLETPLPARSCSWAASLLVSRLGVKWPLP